MATFAAVITTSAPSGTTIYYTLIRGTAAAPTIGTRTAMTSTSTTGSTAIWEADITWDNSWVCPRIKLDNGSTCWADGVTISNVTQVAGTATSLGAVTGTNSLTVEGTGISTSDR